MKELKIDPELRDLLPPMTDEEFKQLEKNIVENGFDKNFPIMEWNGFIADGHNRYSICKKHNIEPVIGTLAYDTKEEVMEWMLDIQLGRRNLSPIQRIAITEKYRPIYEKQARENSLKNLKQNQLSEKSNLTNRDNNKSTNDKLAKMANVKPTTYKMGAKILNSNNEDLKQRVLSGETAISAGYKELLGKNVKSKENVKSEEHITTSTPIQPTEKVQSKQQANQVSEEVRQICEDLKTERTKEYLDSIWDYRIDIIECMNADFERFYNGFVSTLEDMENHVTKRELDECITNAENMVKKMLSAIEVAKKINLKMEG